MTGAPTCEPVVSWNAEPTALTTRTAAHRFERLPDRAKWDVEVLRDQADSCAIGHPGRPTGCSSPTTPSPIS
ncbi:hypothetical protein [Planobispora rosea]|uniref:hypothetical protein n=1 Tax=Planobispora rosea TaxID=35762 RepID=UPI00159F332D|nr:hypothetical protein [Planobispora rosea]